MGGEIWRIRFRGVGRGCKRRNRRPLFGRDPTEHRPFAEHLTAEYRVKTSGRGRTVDEWKLRPERSDNHWFDWPTCY
jgi:hypothetical protein